MEKKMQKESKKIWDCESSLYDSFELNAIERRLYSSIHSKTLSMPHLSDSRRLIPSAPASRPLGLGHTRKSTPSKMARSFQKLFRSVFKTKQQLSTTTTRSGDSLFQEEEEKCRYGNDFYVAGRICDKLTSAVLPTILEDPVFGGYSLRSPPRRSASNRFTVVFPSS